MQQQPGRDPNQPAKPREHEIGSRTAIGGDGADPGVAAEPEGPEHATGGQDPAMGGAKPAMLGVYEQPDGADRASPLMPLLVVLLVIAILALIGYALFATRESGAAGLTTGSVSESAMRPA